jgi:hypothetical protein
MKKLVLMVEGEGDQAAMPVLLKRLLTDLQGWDCLQLDNRQPLKVGPVEALTGRNKAAWLKYLQVAGRRPGAAAVLLVLDGDAPMVEESPFCAGSVAREMGRRAQAVGAGKIFSLACVFAKQEYESWLMAGVASLAGRPLPDGRGGVQRGVVCDVSDPDDAPRDAKGWLTEKMGRTYKPTTDQEPLTAMVNLTQIRTRGPRSFVQLEKAVRLLIEAARENRHVISPSGGN